MDWFYCYWCRIKFRVIEEREQIDHPLEPYVCPRCGANTHLLNWKIYNLSNQRNKQKKENDWENFENNHRQNEF